MKTYTVTSISVTGRKNKVFHANQTVTENDFIPGRAEQLFKSGHLFRQLPKIKIGVLIPTRGNRISFLQQAKHLLSKQTLQPDFIEVVDDEPLTAAVDITYRYRIGVDRLKAKGAGVILFWEDDDWYASNYIETMVNEWNKRGNPEIFGIGTTTYYHIGCNKYLTISHEKRSSMFCTMIRSTADITWCKDDYPYADVVVWDQLKGKTFMPVKPICLGIKHGIGMVGGGGHTEDYKHYNKIDSAKSFLKSIVGEDEGFYSNEIKK